MPSVPLLNFTDSLSENPGRRARFITTLGRGLSEHGFVMVTGHGVDPSLLTAAYHTASRLFALPEGVKRAYERPAIARQRGYTPFGVERARDGNHADLKEFWHVGRELPADHPRARSGQMPGNLFPDAIPEAGPVFLSLYIALEGFALKLLECVGEWLGQPPEWFPLLTQEGDSILRVLHYPAVPDAVSGAVRAAAHEDINLMTVLPASTGPGLELLDREGRWLPIDAPGGVMVCDTGDMMALLTGGLLPATTHRVVNPHAGDSRSRYSLPFFLHPRPDAWLEPLRGAGPGILAGDFLRKRLLENGVMDPRG